MSPLNLTVDSPAPVVTKPAVSENLLELLAEQALEAQQEADKAATAAKAATEKFRKALEAAGKLDADTKVVGIVRTTIFPTARFNEDLARGLLTKKLQKECEKTVLDSALVKAKVSPEQYKQMQAVTGMTLKLSIDKEQVS
jgi:CRISPR/Cas system-associated protein Csm6